MNRHLLGRIGAQQVSAREGGDEELLPPDQFHHQDGAECHR